jgi:hypothetical protein
MVAEKWAAGCDLASVMAHPDTLRLAEERTGEGAAR